MSNVTKTVTRGPVTIDKISVSAYQKDGMLTAQLRQQVTIETTYPAPSNSDGITSNLFADEFSSKGKTYSNTENRVAFLIVPSHITVQILQARLAQLMTGGSNPGIMKVTSSSPILTDNQVYAINEGLKTKDQFADSQVVRYSDKNTEGKAGQLILDDSGNPIYKRNFFIDNVTEDVSRGDSEGVYMSAQIETELASLRANIVDNGLLF